MRILLALLCLSLLPLRADVLNLQVSAGGDDGMCHSTSTFDNTATVMYAPGNHDGWPNSSVYFRFTGVSGLAGATITAAYIEVFMEEGYGTPLSRIYMERANAPAAPTTCADFAGRTRSTASVAWNISSWSGIQFYQSPSLVSVLQEIADNHDPSVIQVFWQNDGSSSMSGYTQHTYDFLAERGAKLHIEYTPSSPESPKRRLMTVD